uniref:Uncharacterized protein n=1 Tax=Chromera velia CCMP2878 TaxID=1169474 RepID=A0A0G4FN18_9ALVE|eukprot:Cvel_3548.t1-p1 / transcript=Cvel_3548.t1 / gene=Cvel_3548 / organism=Chromera_velia_CCMP2878 / gene_product=hypothetical protein / transcript_product=hypothetical protein / location=Cvel_scaffold144:122769-123723(-) / protein_length=134 / sequence_SO=supercontig / SO=protein_coding / is_pseudo=false
MFSGTSRWPALSPSGGGGKGGGKDEIHVQWLIRTNECEFTHLLQGPSFVHGLESSGFRYQQIIEKLNREERGQLAKLHLRVKEKGGQYEAGPNRKNKKLLREILKCLTEEHSRLMMEEWSRCCVPVAAHRVPPT